jgi:hypothetical protein
MPSKFRPNGAARALLDPLIAKYQTQAALYDALKSDWGELMTEAMRRDRAQNSNTVSSSLTTNFLILGATTQVPPQFAAVPMFARAVAPDPYKPLSTGELKYNVSSQAGGDVLTNATSFETGDSTLNAV